MERLIGCLISREACVLLWILVNIACKLEAVFKIGCLTADRGSH